MAQLLAIFPLDTVLLPGAPLPLHIFEPRYRALVADVWETRGRVESPGFGIVAVSRADLGADVHGPGRRRDARNGALAANDPNGIAGFDAGDDLRLARIGTVAEIVELEPYPDGRSDLLTIGARRFRLLDLEANGKPYLEARVEWLPEDEGQISPALISAAEMRCTSYLGALAELAGRELPPLEFASDPVALSYQVARRLRLANRERQSLLEASTAAGRLRVALWLLRRETLLLTRTRSVPVSPGLLHVESRPN